MTTYAGPHHLDQSLAPGTLRLLVLVEDLGGVGAAARACGIGQPQASRALSGLERRLGCRLLRRGPLGSTPTEEGRAVAELARGVLDAYEPLERLSAQLTVRPVTSLRLAASRTVGEQLVPLWIQAITQMDPIVQVSFHVDNSTRVMQLVRSGEVPLGFVEVPETPAGFTVEVLRRDRMMLIVPPGHPWAQRATTSGASTPPVPDLAAARFVEREPGSGTRAMLDALLPGRRPPVAVFDSNTAIVRAVAAGAGPALLSELAVREPVATGAVAVIDLDDRRLERPLCAIWQTGATPSRLVARILGVIRRTPEPVSTA